MALRWGMSEGAYRKFAYIFSKPLPFKIDSVAPISDASYIRDVIHYAHKHGLPGRDWYKKVVVSPQEDGTVLVRSKTSQAFETLTPKHEIKTIFDLLKMVDENTIKDGYTCYITDPVDEVKETLAGFTKYDILEVGTQTITIKVKDDE